MDKARIYTKAAQIMERGEVGWWGLALDEAGQPQPGGNDGRSPMQRKVERTFGIGFLGEFEDVEHAITSLYLMAAIERQSEPRRK